MKSNLNSISTLPQST